MYYERKIFTALSISALDAAIKHFRDVYFSEPKILHVSPLNYGTAWEVIKGFSECWEIDEYGHMRCHMRIKKEPEFSDEEWCISGIKTVSEDIRAIGYKEL